MLTDELKGRLDEWSTHFRYDVQNVAEITENSSVSVVIEKYNLLLSSLAEIARLNEKLSPDILKGIAALEERYPSEMTVAYAQKHMPFDDASYTVQDGWTVTGIEKTSKPGWYLLYNPDQNPNGVPARGNVKLYRK